MHTYANFMSLWCFGGWRGNCYWVCTWACAWATACLSSSRKLTSTEVFKVRLYSEEEIDEICLYRRDLLPLYPDFDVECLRRWVQVNAFICRPYTSEVSILHSLWRLRSVTVLRCLWRNSSELSVDPSMGNGCWASCTTIWEWSVHSYIFKHTQVTTSAKFWCINK